MLQRRLTPLILAALLPLGAATAADIGFVDMQRVLEESAVGKRVQEELRTQFEPKAQELGKEEQEIRAMQETLARDAPLMSKDQVAKKEGELKERIEAYQKAAGAAQQALLRVQQERGREIMAPARKAVDAVAKKKKLSLVMESAQTGLLYTDDALDITDSVIKQMDASTR